MEKCKSPRDSLQTVTDNRTGKSPCQALRLCVEPEQEMKSTSNDNRWCPGSTCCFPGAAHGSCEVGNRSLTFQMNREIKYLIQEHRATEWPSLCRHITLTSKSTRSCRPTEYLGGRMESQESGQCDLSWALETDSDLPGELVPVPPALGQTVY